MRNKVSRLLLITSVIIFSFTNCTKTTEDNSTPPTTTPTNYQTESTTQTEDEARVSAEVDAVDTDANTALEATPQINGRTEGLICDATFTYDTTATTRFITIVYDGTNCGGNRSRTGTIVLSMPKNKRWKDAEAVLTVTFQNLKVTRLSDNKSITFNGIKTITNVTGGRLIQLASLGTITHRIQSNGLTITFDNGTSRIWQVDKQRVFTYDNGIVITVTGLHTEGSITNIAEWGTNRLGQAFSTSTAVPLVVRQDCDFRLVSGKLIHNIPNLAVNVTFGLNADGNTTTCPPPGGHYYYKVQWTTADSASHTLIFPY